MKKVVIFTEEDSLNIHVLEKVLCILPKKDIELLVEGVGQDLGSDLGMKGEDDKDKEKGNNDRVQKAMKNGKIADKEVDGEDEEDEEDDIKRLKRREEQGCRQEREVGGGKLEEGEEERVNGHQILKKVKERSPSKNVLRESNRKKSLNLIISNNDDISNSNGIRNKKNGKNNDDKNDDEKNNDDNDNSDDDDDDDDDSNIDSDDNSSSDYDHRDGKAIQLVEARTLSKYKYDVENDVNTPNTKIGNIIEHRVKKSNKEDHNDNNNDSNNNHNNNDDNNNHGISLLGFESKSILNNNFEEYSDYIENFKNLPESSSRRIRTFDFNEILCIFSTPNSLILQRTCDNVIFTGTLQNLITVQDLDLKLYVIDDTLFEWSRDAAMSGWMYKQSVRTCPGNNNSSAYLTEGEKEHKNFLRLRSNRIEYSKDEILSMENLLLLTSPEGKEVEKEVEKEKKESKETEEANKKEVEKMKEKGEEKKTEKKEEEGNEKGKEISTNILPKSIPVTGIVLSTLSNSASNQSTTSSTSIDSTDGSSSDGFGLRSGFCNGTTTREEKDKKVKEGEEEGEEEEEKEKEGNTREEKNRKMIVDIGSSHVDCNNDKKKIDDDIDDTKLHSTNNDNNNNDNKNDNNMINNDNNNNNNDQKDITNIISNKQSDSNIAISSLPLPLALPLSLPPSIVSTTSQFSTFSISDLLFPKQNSSTVIPTNMSVSTSDKNVRAQNDQVSSSIFRSFGNYTR